jgi:hypothetical protein
MLLNFQRQFALPVWSGEKRQTIRARGNRVHVPKADDVAHCYTGLRTSNTQLLGRFVIMSVRVLRMDIGPDGLTDVVLGGDPVSYAEDLDKLARADGFADGAAMTKWFQRNHPPGEFYGHVIQWAYNPGDCGPRPVGCEVKAGEKGGSV